MLNWDYVLPKNWKPKTDEEWVWFLVRKINHNDLTGIPRKILAKFFPEIKKVLDPGKKVILEYFLNKYKWI